MKCGQPRRFLFLMVLLLICTGGGIAAVAAQAFQYPDKLPVYIQASAKWDSGTTHDDGKGGKADNFERNYGFNWMIITGVLELDRAGSPLVNNGGTMAMPVLNYVPTKMNVCWIYEETSEELDFPGPHPCFDKGINIIHKYQNAGLLHATDSRPNLSIMTFASSAVPFMQNLSDQEKEYAAQLQAQLQSQMQGSMPDFYQFAFGGGSPVFEFTGNIKVPGKRRKQDCSYEDSETEYKPFTVGVQMQLPKDGSMSGYKTWQADSKGVNPPTFGISISDMTEHKGEEPLDPPVSREGDVTYSLNWHFGELQVPDKEGECEELQQRLNFIKLMMEAYKNKALRDLAEGWSGSRSFKLNLYQHLVEDAVMGATYANNDLQGQLQDVGDADGNDAAEDFSEQNQTSWQDGPPEDESGNNPFAKDDPVSQNDEPEHGKGSANMATTPFPNPAGDGWGFVTITDHSSGNPLIVEIYDGQGNLICSGGSDLSKANWKNKFGNKAGDGLWGGSMKHEQNHVRQFCDTKGQLGGPTDSPNELGDRELESYEIEMREILKTMKELGCS